MKDPIAVKAPSDIKAFEVKQAVIGLELGQTDDNVLAYAQYFTKHIPTSAACFVHVIPAPQLLEAFYENIAGRFDIKASIHANLLKKISPLFKDVNVTKEYEVKEGNPLKELVDAAEEKAADLVIIGQKSNAQKHGILAKNLARAAAGNALVVPEKAVVNISKILVPIDFSPNSVKAFQTALAINQQLKEKATIVCLNVFDLPNFSAYDVGRSPAQFKTWIIDSRKEAFAHFLNTYAPDNQNNISTVLIEREGPGLAHYIMDYAQKEHFDLMVMGAKGHSTIERLLMGSVTEKILSMNEFMATLVVK
ncbi:MAG: universal stress protein [Saprospiraceae bacterium]